MIKKNKKGVSVILSLVIITGVILASILIAYKWGLPILGNNQNILELRDVEEKFLELNSKVNQVAIEGDMSSRKFNIHIKKGSLKVDHERNFFKYSLDTSSYFCDSPSVIDMLLMKSMTVPPGINSISGEIYTGSYEFDNITRNFIVSDSEENMNYNYLYLECLNEEDCFKEYKLGDILITNQNKKGFLFSNTRITGHQLEVIFFPLAKKNDNIYKICKANTYLIYLKKDNLDLKGTDCNTVEIFNGMNISSSAFCKNPCSLIISNENGNIKVEQV